MDKNLQEALKWIYASLGGDITDLAAVDDITVILNAIAKLDTVQKIKSATELPAVSSTDNGDVLTVVEGEWAPAAPGGGSDLPSVSSTDNGDVLTVVDGAWDKAAPSGLPAVTSADNGKGLSVQNGAWAKDFFAGYDVVVKMDRPLGEVSLGLATDEDLHLLKGSWAECVRLMDAALPIRACVFFHKFGDNNFATSVIYTVVTAGWHDYGDEVDLLVTGEGGSYANKIEIYLTESGLSLIAP